MINVNVYQSCTAYTHFFQCSLIWWVFVLIMYGLHRGMICMQSCIVYFHINSFEGKNWSNLFHYRPHHLAINKTKNARKTYYQIHANWIRFLCTANCIEAFSRGLLRRSFCVVFWLTFVQSDRGWAELRHCRSWLEWGRERERERVDWLME